MARRPWVDKVGSARRKREARAVTGEFYRMRRARSKNGGGALFERLAVAPMWSNSMPCPPPRGRAKRRIHQPRPEVLFGRMFDRQAASAATKRRLEARA